MVNPESLTFCFMLTYNKIQFLTFSQRVGLKKLISQKMGSFLISYSEFVLKEWTHSIKLKIGVWFFLLIFLRAFGNRLFFS